jgi:predicted transport protein
MSDIKLFRLSENGQQVTELASQQARLEKDLQKLIEANMETFLGARFLASEFSTSNNGRIDSIGLDENNCPVIIEYKRHTSENVINQGLFYYDWLLDHKGEFKLLVMSKLDNEIADKIEWDGARLICIASDYNKYDEYAIKQIDRNIELMRYKYFGDNLLMLELVNTQISKQQPKSSVPKITAVKKARTSDPKFSDMYHQEILEYADETLVQRYEQICDYCESLGDDVQRKELKLYTAFKRIKNFASFYVLPSKKTINMYLKVDPLTVELEDEFSHDVTKRGHWGTGDLEIIIRSEEDIEKAKPLIKMSFENS